MSPSPTGPQPVRRRTVAVVGPADATPEQLAVAEQVGAALAAAGAVVITGGLGGVMAAAARGATAADGVVVGLLPGRDAAAADPAVTVPLPTGLGEARDAVVAGADAVVAVGGSWGTLAEVALACRLGRPVAVLAGWQVHGGDGGAPPGGPVHVMDVTGAISVALGG